MRVYPLLFLVALGCWVFDISELKSILITGLPTSGGAFGICSLAVSLGLTNLEEWGEIAEMKGGLLSSSFPLVEKLPFLECCRVAVLGGGMLFVGWE